MTSQTLLVLAASHYQIPVIREARAMGCRVITADNRPHNPGHALADESHAIDTTDREAILALARAARVDGIIAPCTDVAVPTQAYVADRLKLFGPSQAAAELLCSKISSAGFFADRGIATPRSIVRSPDYPDARPEFDGTRWVVKPDRSSGCKGVSIVRSEAEFERALVASREYAADGALLIQEYLDGAQGTCEGILIDGRVAWHALLDRQAAAPPYAATLGHSLPSSVAPAARQKLLRAIEASLTALDIFHGVFDCDFVVLNDEPYVLEIAPRLGGNGISTLLEICTSVSIANLAVQFALGQPVRAPASRLQRPGAVAILGVPRDGCFRYRVDQRSELARLDWVVSLEIDRQVGDPVKAFHHDGQRVGIAFVLGDDPLDVIRKREIVRRRLDLTSEPPDLTSAGSRLTHGGHPGEGEARAPKGTGKR